MAPSASLKLSARRGVANQDGEFVKPIILQEGNRPPISRQALGKHIDGVGIIEI
jgi:hypothetical protein